jgi:hypothetical protein
MTKFDTDPLEEYIVDKNKTTEGAEAITVTGLVEEGNRRIRKKFKDLDLPVPKDISKEQVYLIDPEEFKKNKNIEETCLGYAQINYNDKKILIKKEEILDDSSIGWLLDRHEDCRDPQRKDGGGHEIWDEWYEEATAEAYDKGFSRKDGEEEGRYDEIVDTVLNQRRKKYDEETMEQRDFLQNINNQWFLHVCIHEMLHLHGYTKWKKDPILDIQITSRMGYETTINKKILRKMQFKKIGGRNIENEEYKLLHFQSLNEAVVEKMALSMSDKERMDMEIADVAYECSTPTCYKKERTLLEKILKMIAEKQGRDMDEVWHDFQRAHMTGNLMHLRMIERALGKGALRLYAGLRTGDDKTHDMFVEFIETDNEKKKKKLFSKITAKNKYKKK